MCGTEIETYEWTEELKNPQSYDKGGIIFLDDLNNKKRTIMEFKLCSIDENIKIYLFSYSFRIIANFQNELFELMVLSLIYSNQRSSETLKISNMRKQLWIWHFKNSNT